MQSTPARRRLLCGSTLAALTPLARAAAAGTKPNVIVIVAGDLGYAGLSYTGCRDYETPNIDALFGFMQLELEPGVARTIAE